MTFKKGERVLTEEGEMGEILFVDRDGSEAQVALKHTSTKLRMDSLRKFDEAQLGKRARRSRKAGA